MALAGEELHATLTKLFLGMTSIAKMLTQWRENETGKTPEQTMQQLGAFIASLPER
jgi:hypothetical protein